MYTRLHTPLPPILPSPGVEVIEHLLRLALALAKRLQVLEHAGARLPILVQVDRLLEEHRVLAQELQLYLVHRAVLVEGQVLRAERAAANRVRLVFPLLAADTKSQLVDDPHGRRDLHDTKCR